MLRMIDETIIYKNPNPAHQSLCAVFPSVTLLSNGELLCLFKLGQARSSYDAHLELARSNDGGKTWNLEGPAAIPPSSEACTFSIAAIAQSNDQTIYITGTVIDASNPEEPMFHPETEGMKNSRIVITLSDDNGHTWDALREIDIGLRQPCANERVITLKDGRLMQAFSIWKDYHAEGLWDQKSGVVFSKDKGKSWDNPVVSAYDPDRNKSYWDQGICQLRDGTLLGLFWTADNVQKKTVNVHRVFSCDGGRTWSRPEEVNFMTEFCRPMELKNGQILCVCNYRKSPAGIKAILSSDKGATWKTDEIFTIWDATTGVEKNIFSDFLNFDFGTPSVVQLPDGTIVVTFYAYENHVCHIRCRRFIFD